MKRKSICEQKYKNNNTIERNKTLLLPNVKNFFSYTKIFVSFDSIASETIGSQRSEQIVRIVLRVVFIRDLIDKSMKK